MKRIKVFIVLGLLLVVVFGVYKFWDNSKFRVTNTTPSTSQSVATSTSVIRIDFNHDLSDDYNYDRTMVKEGQSFVSEIERQGRSLYVRVFELREGNTYKISFNKIISSNSETIDNLKLEFKAIYIPYNKLTQAQRDLEVGETDRFEAEDPILEHIPYSEIGFALEPVNEVDEEGAYVLNINLKIFLSNADRGYENEATDAYKDQALNYLRSKGIKPEDYKFNYIINQPAY